MSEQFLYELPHGHNLSFLTAGHSGADYRTKLYEYDGIAPEPRERIEAVQLEETSLPEGKLMALNLMTRNAHEFARTQGILDADCSTVLRYSTGIDPKTYFFRTAALVGDAQTETLLEDFANMAGDTPLTRVSNAALELRRAIR